MRAAVRKQHAGFNFIKVSYNSENPPIGCADETRKHDELAVMITSEVVQPKGLRSWYLIPSIMNRQEIALEAATQYPNADLKFKSWLRRDFITSLQSSQPEIAGNRTAILGSLWVVFIVILLAFPLGVIMFCQMPSLVF